MGIQAVGVPCWSVLDDHGPGILVEEGFEVFFGVVVVQVSVDLAAVVWSSTLRGRWARDHLLQSRAGWCANLVKGRRWRRWP